jgi:hypothetical protein
VSAGSSWLLTEINPADHDRALGLYTQDARHRLTHVSFSEIVALLGPKGAPVTSDPDFMPMKMLTAFLYERGAGLD